MAIFVIGATNSEGSKSADIIREALDRQVKDDNNTKFSIITLQLLRQSRANIRTFGNWQDTYLDVTDGHGIRITHRDQGHLLFKPVKFSEFPEAMVVRTPQNMKMLASGFYEKEWAVMDALDRAEIKALADQRRASMEPEALKAEMDRLSGKGQSAAKAPEKDVQGRTLDERQKAADEESLRRRELKIEQDAKDLERRKKEFEEEKNKTIEAGVATVQYSKSKLNKMTIDKLREAAKEFGIVPAEDDTRPKIMEAILNAQAGVKQEEKGAEG